MEISDRSYERLTESDLQRISQLALKKLEDVFRAKVAGLYRNRIIAITLCQGSALHFIDGRRGVKDLDVWVFFKVGPTKPFPYRAHWNVDFGPSHLGRSAKDKGYEGRRIDLMGRSIAVHRGDTPASSIARWLTSPAKSPQLIKLRPIIGLYPSDLFATKLWIPEVSHQ